MFGFHKRQRSLISIKELEKEDQLERLHRREDEADVDGSDDEETVSADTHRQTRNLTMTYLLFLAEAIMASSLSAQVAILAPTATGCFDTDASFLRSISECAYFTGSSAGVLWGWSADRVGRRSVALFGLVGMAVCCVSMGFARGFVAFAILRFMAGMIGSAVTVAGMAMLADVTQGSKGRAQVVARLPMIAFCGSLGPLAANSIRHLSERQVFEVLEKYPGLSGQLACASLVGMIALAEALLLEEVGLIFYEMFWAFPVLYTIIPLAGLAASSDRVAPAVAAVISVVAMLVKATLAGAAQVLVLLLILSAAPDAQSTGTTIGVLSIAELFKASAVGVSGISYYLSSAYSMQVVNGSLWAALAVTALAGAMVTRKLRETPRVGTDIPEACLVWQGMFDSESEGEVSV
ncbi:hypothetical protein B0A54_04669 [Friedmanniomyces endolithicus]|uniref:Major facilitator superfamily (MFS) profile domain-containing protein n=1 Tax=Friedmanniomyces endolithicus TaxID=329885 RepID=A0A4U0V7C6_9PEZI|nr:hypothetical protein B0A54_04669 [Friedmanniomyces endolithicus]